MSTTKPAQTEWMTFSASNAAELLSDKRTFLSYAGRKVRKDNKWGTWEQSDRGPVACWERGAKEPITAALLTGMDLQFTLAEIEAAPRGTFRDDVTGEPVGGSASASAPVTRMSASEQALFDGFMMRTREREAKAKADAIELKAREDRVASLRAISREVQGLPPETVAPVAAASLPMDARSVRERELRAVGASVFGCAAKVEAAAVDPAKLTERERRVAELRALGASVR